MFLSFTRAQARAVDAGFALVPTRLLPLPPSPRGEHARLLAIAAARRLRAQERLHGQRWEDAEYWIACAPVAVSKAAATRASFSPLP